MIRHPERSVVGGWVAPGFEAVADAFEASASDLAPGGGALAAELHGRPVVDLWTGFSGEGEPWERDTLGVLYSATKGLTTITAQLLCDRGALDLDAPVASYWPEFSQNGKESIPLRDLLTHRAGLVGLDGHESLLQFDGTGFDRTDEIACRLASARPAWPPGTAHGYHASTFGWLVGEVVRRVTGRTLGTVFAEEMAVPLDLDLRIGTYGDDLRRVACMYPPGAEPAKAPSATRTAEAWFTNPDTLGGQAFFARRGTSLMAHMADLMNHRRMLEAELGGGNGTGTARSLARMYGMLGNGGVVDGTRVLSERIVSAWARPAACGTDIVLGVPWRWATGYHLQTPFFTVDGRYPLPLGPNLDAFGHGGFGGQIAGVDPVTGVSVGFIRSRLGLNNGYGARLVEVVGECAART